MSAPLIFPGLHQPSDAHHFRRACISINRLLGRKKPVEGCDVVVDSAAFTELARHGHYRRPVAAYAAELTRLVNNRVVRVLIAVAQDYMCEPFMLARTGLTVPDHQRLTIERYDALLATRPPCLIMPVLQGYDPAEYTTHLDSYGNRLGLGAWVGVGSVCKRNAKPEAILAVLYAIKRRRPDLRLHGFGVKLTSLLHAGVRELLHSADSMAWSFAARKEGRSPNDWREANAFVRKVEAAANAPFSPWQMPLLLEAAA